MGEFHITHKYILNNNIQYLYSGNRTEMLYRGSGDYPNFDQLRINKENSDLKKRTLKTFKFQYQPDKFLLPRAPAFRFYSRHAVSGMVDRLMRPTIARVGVSSENFDLLKCKDDVKEPDKSGFPSYRKFQKEDVQKIVHRLYKGHTIMSKVKLRDTFEVSRSRPNSFREATMLTAMVPMNTSMPMVQS